VLAPVALAVALALAAAPAAETPVREQVVELLGAIHTLPVDQLRALGPEAITALADIAVSPGSNVRRARALDALAALGGTRAEDAARTVAARTGEPRAVRRAAVRGLGRLAGPDRAGAALAPYLEKDRDPAIRAAAAEALAAHAPAECGRVRARARAEKDGARFSAALRTCEQAAPAASPPPR
jgi:hypothetical protein